MAEPKKKKIVDADSGKEVKAGSRKKKAAAPVGNATGFRVGAIILWVVALAFEVLAYLVLIGKVNLNFMPSLWQMIAFLVLDLICVIVGSQFWKKANHIKPASEKNKTLFWLWNNMGLIVCAVCFIPFVILALTNKEADKKTKVIATVVAVIALLIGGACSIDYNPVSAEEQQAAMEAISDDVYWSPFGKVYHTHDDCSSLNQSDTLTYGTVEQAIAENRTRLCSYCAKRDEITGVTTDGKDVSDVEFEDEVEEEVEEELEVEEDIDADVEAEEDIEEAEE
ncbi:MAG: hypothetical protein IJA29_04220 [Lachnospiraceae bacterium]|nr:hypothetical protein [Lachnospiraceae bacterium]